MHHEPAALRKPRTRLRRPPWAAWAGAAAFWLLYSALALWTLFGLVQFPRIDGYHAAMLRDMVEGAAYRPFVTRALVPVIIRFFLWLLPEGAEEALRQAIADSPAGPFLVVGFDYSEADLALYAVAVGVMFLLLLLFAAALHDLLRGLFVLPRGLQYAASLFGLALIRPYFAFFYHYVYDFGSLALATLVLAMLAHRRWRGFCLAYLLASLNKETTLLFTLFFAIHYRRRLPGPLFRRLLVFQAVVFALTRGALAVIFRDNPGGPLEFYLFSHNLMIFLERFYLYLPPLRVFLTFAVLSFYRWREKPAFLKDALWMLAVMLGLDLFFGMVDEVRDLYEVYPVALALATHSAGRFFKVLSVRDEPAQGAAA